jgi:hypothetical protein
LSHDADPRFAAAIANAHKHMMQFTNDQNERMYILQKERPDSPLKIDAAIAGAFSWQGRLEAIAAGVRGRADAVDPSYADDERRPEMSGMRNKEF